jgi:hypothetical protein
MAAPADLLGDVLGDVAQPALKRVEAEHPDRAFVLTREQLLDDGLQIGMLGVGFAPDAAEPAEIVHHQREIVIGAAKARSPYAYWNSTPKRNSKPGRAIRSGSGEQLGAGRR